MKPLHSKAAQFDLNQVINEENPVQLIQMGSPIPMEELLDYMLKLQGSLSLEDTFKTMIKTIRQHSVVDHLEYVNQEIETHIVIGHKEPNTFSYNISDENERALGTLVVSRKNSFDDNDIELIESLICYAMFCIRNNIHYLYAMQTSLTDPLTATGNRRALQKALSHERELAKRHSSPFSVLTIDIDEFKQINDNYGHDIGDRFLKELSRSLYECTREYDELFRVGGDEFVIVLGQGDAETALNVAYRILKKIRHQVFNIKNESLSTTLSIGMALYTEGDDNQSLLDRADKALYRAKNQGKDCVRT